MEMESIKRLLLGIGLDNEDGHVRLTHGENFYIIGGSEETHEVMQEKFIRFNEKLKSKGKRLEQLRKDEFFELADECDMNIIVTDDVDWSDAEERGRE